MKKQQQHGFDAIHVAVGSPASVRYAMRSATVAYPPTLTADVSVPETCRHRIHRMSKTWHATQ